MVGSVLSGEPSCGGAFAEQSTWGQDDGRLVGRLVGPFYGHWPW